MLTYYVDSWGVARLARDAQGVVPVSLCPSCYGAVFLGGERVTLCNCCGIVMHTGCLTHSIPLMQQYRMPACRACWSYD